MRVILRYAQVVSITNVPTLPLVHPEEEIVEAPDVVGVGWYRVGNAWIPPEKERNSLYESHLSS